MKSVQNWVDRYQKACHFALKAFYCTITHQNYIYLLFTSYPFPKEWQFCILLTLRLQRYSKWSWQLWKLSTLFEKRFIAQKYTKTTSSIFIHILFIFPLGRECSIPGQACRVSCLGRLPGSSVCSGQVLFSMKCILLPTFLISILFLCQMVANGIFEFSSCYLLCQQSGSQSPDWTHTH